jgi:hypothetical protein
MPTLGLFQHLSKIGATTRRIAIALGARSESRFTRRALVLQTNKVKRKNRLPFALALSCDPV